MIVGDTVRPNTNYLEFEFSGKDWMSQLNILFNGRESLTYLTKHYRCNELKIPTWRDSIPPDFRIQVVDEELLHTAQIELDEGRDSHFHPCEWALGFGSISNYLTHGSGFAVMVGDQMVSWSMSDCVAKNHAEIGIYTVPEHRRKGLGTIAAAATVEYCLNTGIESVGWHCNDSNIASQRTAKKIGFVYQDTFIRHYIVSPEWRHIAELGLRDFHNGEFLNCLDKYRNVFELTDEAEDYIYHIAAMAAGKVGEFDQSLTWLQGAVAHGWKNLAYTESRIEFEPLKGSPEWGSIIRMVRENQEDTNPLLQ